VTVDPLGLAPDVARADERLLATAATLDEAAVRAPSQLPGWTRGHVLAHIARNADSYVNLLTWARTGVETPMYPSREARAADIAASADHPPERLRAELTATAADLDSALAALTPEQWQAQVRSALGRPLPAAQVPWMRIREVWLHAVDLDAGADMADVPDGVVDLLLDEVTTTLSAADGCPAATLAPTDRDRSLRLGGAAGPVVAAPAATLVGWLTGRTTLPDAPKPPPWL